MKIYCISGLGADERVFQDLNLDFETIPISWIETYENENISQYSKRLSSIINTHEEFAILGVSFGGLVAVEISQQLNPTITILISSAETKDNLRAIYRAIGKLNILKLIPAFMFNPPRLIANWIFGAKRIEILDQILTDTNFKFAKWSAIQLTTWKNTRKVQNNIIKIEGSNDKLIPRTKDEDSIVVENGEHFMIVDKADEISKIINQEIKNARQQ